MDASRTLYWHRSFVSTDSCIRIACPLSHSCIGCRVPRAVLLGPLVRNDVLPLHREATPHVASLPTDSHPFVPNSQPYLSVDGQLWRLPTNCPRARRKDGEQHALEQLLGTLCLGRWCLVRLRTLPSAKPDAQELLHAGKFPFQLEILWPIPRCLVLHGRSGYKVSLASFVSGSSCVCGAICVPSFTLRW